MAPRVLKSTHAVAPHDFGQYLHRATVSTIWGSTTPVVSGSTGSVKVVKSGKVLSRSKGTYKITECCMQPVGHR